MYEEHPFEVKIFGAEYVVKHLPAESDTGMFGGNSHWRGPVWMLVNSMLLRALHPFYLYYGDDFKIKCPTESGQLMTLYEVAAEIAKRLYSIFLRNDDGKRPVLAALIILTAIRISATSFRSMNIFMAIIAVYKHAGPVKTRLPESVSSGSGNAASAS